MAKGLRATTKKNNRVKIRARVYAPVDEARTERLSQKLLELASQPRPAKTEMDVDAEKEVSSKDQDAQTAEEMDVDGATKNGRSSSSTRRAPKKEIRVQKAHRRVRNELVFRKRVFKKTKGGPGKSNR